MLNIGSFQAHSCQGVSRRTFLKAGALAPFATLAGQAAEYGEAQAKSVILVWLWGAPSHIDTFDPKPNAPAEYRGPFSTIPTRTPGVRYSELLPRLAARSQNYTLIRSHKNFHSGHLEAGTLGLTGFADNDANGLAPNFGSIVARQRGPGTLPPFIGLGRGTPRDVVGSVKGFGGGTWGRVYDPFMVGCDELGRIDIPSLKLLDGLSPAALEDRRRLLKELDDHARRIDATPSGRWDGIYQRAYNLLNSPEARKALDLSREDERTRRAYGQSSFGQSCLLARRLVEAHVPFILVNWSQYVEAMTPNCDFGWDTHIYNFELLPDRHCPIFDRAFSNLLDDLGQRGLLKSTLVVAMGEFGRTPRITREAARDHWPRCYFSLWAGGGVQPGRVIGQSDSVGDDPITEPITPLMVGTTILDLAGVSSAARASLRVLSGGRVIHELL
jgi:hypothetical protein